MRLVQLQIQLLIQLFHLPQQPRGQQIRAHGQVVTAESVEAVLTDSIHFVENAQAMHNACVIGRLAPLSEDDMESFAKYFKRGRHVDKLWRYYIESGQAAGVIPADWQI